MNVAQKWISIGCACALGLIVIIPPWHQTFRSQPLAYKEDLGHHLLWSPPPPTGEQMNAPASEWEVTINWGGLFWQCGSIVAMGAILYFTLRKIPLSVKNRSLILTSVFLALCLPAPPPTGWPLLFWVAIATVSPFMDTGHVGLWGVVYLAAKFLTLYSAGAFALLSGVLWIARRYARDSTNSRDNDRYTTEL
jgi:hypothetical protein